MTRCWPRSPGRAGASSSTGTSKGRTIVANFPATLPLFFKTFCTLNADVEAVIAGDERLTFRQLDEISDRLARGLVARGIAKGDRVGIAMRNCPAWVLAYMAVAQGGRGRDLAQRLVAARRAGTCAAADPAQADPGRRPAGQAHRRHLRRPARSRRSTSSGLQKRLSPICWPTSKTTLPCPRLRPTTMRPSCSPPARPARPRARCRPTGR